MPRVEALSGVAEDGFDVGRVRSGREELGRIDRGTSSWCRRLRGADLGVIVRRADGVATLEHVVLEGA